MKKKDQAIKSRNSQVSSCQNLLNAKFKKTATIVVGASALASAILFLMTADAPIAYNIILGAAMLLWILWTLPNLQLGLAAALFFAQPLYIPFGNSDFTLPKISFTVIFVAVIVLVWSFDKIRKRQATFQLTSLILPSGLVILSALLSLINSIEPIGDLQYVFIIMFYLILGIWLSNIVKDANDVRLMAGALFASLALSAIYGLLQYFGLVTGYHGFSVGSEEMGTTLGNRNYLGGCIAYLYPLGLALLFYARSRWTKVMMLVALPLFFTSLIAIDSDSSWLAFMLGVLVFTGLIWLTGRLSEFNSMRNRALNLVSLTLFMAGLFLGATLLFQFKITSPFGPVPEGLSRFSWLGWIAIAPLMLLLSFAVAGKVLEKLRRFWLSGAMAVILIAAAAILLTPVGNAVKQSISQITSQATAYLRAQFWLVGYEMFKAHPIAGIGIGDYKKEYLPYKAVFLKTYATEALREPLAYETPAAHAHNEYVQIGAEMGLIGLIALVLFAAFVAKRTFGAVRRNESSELQWITIGLGAGLVPVASDALFSFPLHIPTNALVITFLIAALYSGVLGEQKNLIRLKQLGVYLLTAILLLIALIGSIFAYREWQADVNFFAGQRLLDRGDPRGEPLMLKSIELSLAPSQVIYKLGLWYYNSGNLTKAKEYLGKSLTRFGRMDSYYLLALIYTQQGEFETAQKYLDTLLSFNPPEKFKNERVPYLKALILNEQGQSEEAIAILEQLIASSYKPEMIRLDLAEIYLDQGNAERAREYAQTDFIAIQEKLQNMNSSAKPSDRAELLALQKRAQDFLKLLENKEQLK